MAVRRAAVRPRRAVARAAQHHHMSLGSTKGRSLTVQVTRR